MATSFFRQGILRKAWETTWSNKSLWFFGLFAAILSFGEEYDVLSRNGDILNQIPIKFDQFRAFSEGGALQDFWQSLAATVKNDVPGTLIVLLVWAFSIIALAWLVIVSQAALIEGARRGDENRDLNLLEGFDVGMANFWPIFKLNVIMKIAVYGPLLLVGIPLAIAYIKTGSTGVLLTTMLWAFIILFPLITIIAFVTKFAASYIVIKKYPVKQAIAAAWGLFLRHWLVTIELMLILIVINFLVVYMTVSTLFVSLNFPNLNAISWTVLLVVLGFIFSWLTTFQFACWTTMFLRLEEGNAPSKLRRIIHYILNIEDSPSKTAVARARR